jgi:CHAD domain-containing protein
MDLFEQPVQRAARLVALALLADAQKARGRLGDEWNADTLHDFRVAVRRLRSWLRAFRPWLDSSVPKKARRRLRKSARLTGDSRDTAVHLEWLSAQRRELSPRQRIGLAWLVERIEAQKAKADEISSTGVVRAFDQAQRVLTRTLPEYRLRVDCDENDAHAFGPVLATLLREHAATLERRLAKVRGFEDDDRVHRARIAAKRLRYLLEPAATQLDSVAAAGLVADLSALQDTFGDWHDVHVFAAEIVKASEKAAADAAHQLSESVVEGEPTQDAVRAAREHDVTRGLLAVASRLHQRGERAFADAEQRWLGAGEDLAGRVEVVARALESDNLAPNDADVAPRIRALPAASTAALIADIADSHPATPKKLPRPSEESPAPSVT